MKQTPCRTALAAMLAALLTLSPALAAPEQPADTAAAPAENRQQPQTSQADRAEPIEAPIPEPFLPEDQDVPVDESTYREEPSSPSEQPRLADGQPGRGDIEDICTYWEQTGYPEDISYAMEAGGEVKEDGKIYSYWEIGLVGADEARRQQILDLVSPQCLVTFYSCTFSHSQKTQAYQTLLALSQQDENIRQVIFTRNTELVVVGVPEGMEKHYAQLLIHQMGLGAVVSVTDQRYILDEQNRETALTIDGSQSSPFASRESVLAALPGLTFGMDGLRRGLTKADSQPEPRQALWLLVLPAAALSLALALWQRNRRRARLLQTTRGTETRTPALSRRQTARLVREATHSPSPHLLEQLLEQLPKER